LGHMFLLLDKLDPCRSLDISQHQHLSTCATSAASTL
jgi:hypothetical protein